MSSRAIPVRHNARINIMTIPTQIQNAAIKSAVATIIKADGSIAKAIEAMAKRRVHIHLLLAAAERLQ
jgi:hypothetical protein